MLERKQVGTTLKYKGHEIVVRYLGPDLLVYVDGSELSPFYEHAEAARSAGMRHVDLIEEENAK